MRTEQTQFAASVLLTGLAERQELHVLIDLDRATLSAPSAHTGRNATRRSSGCGPDRRWAACRA